MRAAALGRGLAFFPSAARGGGALEMVGAAEGSLDAAVDALGGGGTTATAVGGAAGLGARVRGGVSG